MADITYTAKATRRRASPDIVPGKGNANVLQVLCSATVELATAAASGTTYSFGRIPTNARLTCFTKISGDYLTNTGSATFYLGLASVDANITSDPDALSNGHDVTSAGTAGALTAAAGISNYGLPAWDFVNGVTEDPGGSFDVYGSLVDAAIAGGAGVKTVTVELYGYFD